YIDIYTIDDYFYVTQDGEFRVDTQHESILKYCNYKNTSGTYKCNDYIEMTSCSVIYLLKTLKEKCKLEDDKLAEYVILWLSYKLNRHSPCSATNLNDFYTNHIEKNEYYNKKIKDDDTTTYKDIIDKKKDLMDIKEISKFSSLFSILSYLYYLFHGECLDCEKNWELATNFAEIFEDLIKDPNNIKGSLYTQILSTLSDDYNNLINKYGNKCSISQSISQLTPQNKPVESSLQTSEGTSSSSSILNTSIPGLSIFAIPKKIKDDDTTTYKDIIDKKKDLMDIKEISKFSSLFSILSYLYYLFHGECLDCEKNWELATNFAEIFEDLIKDPNNIKGSLYTQILSTLSDDYNNLINKY
ncbi:Plasmodium variant antigen protein Cir/Yir/Bir, putative, partial [Plasmodium chabaudi adami]